MVGKHHLSDSDPEYVSRNHALGFAERTRKNLQFIETAFCNGEDVHVVTQLTNSLLGLLVFLHERTFVEHIEGITLESLQNQGWPKVEVTLGDGLTLGTVIRHLRNSVAHGRITFSSESRDISKVIVCFEDKRNSHDKVPNWSATMNASQLQQFCMKLVALVEQKIG
jgi:hypothetical protein